MKSIFNYLEKTLILLSILSLTLLLAIQFINYNDNIISTSINNRDNNILSFNYIGNEREKGTIILKNMIPTYSNIEVLINGEYAGDFSKSDEIKVTVYDNDLVEIDGSKYNNKLKVKVVGISNNVILPKLDTVITTSQSIEILSNVKLK